MDSTEKKRIAKKREEIIQILRFAGKDGVTNARLSEISLRYGGQLGKLYELGYVIDKVSLGDGLYRYTLVSEPEKEIVRVKAINKLLSELEKQGKVDKDGLVRLLNENGITVKYESNTYRS